MTDATTGPAWREALALGRRLSTAIEQAGALEGALTSGFLGLCRTPVTAEELAGRTGLAPHTVEAACSALQAMELLHATSDGRVVVSARFAALLDDGTDRRIFDQLGGARVRAGVLRSAFADGDAGSYWTLGSNERRALATAATSDARTRFGRDRMVESKEDLPEWAEALAGGGRFLDLGCGIGGGICSYLVEDPEMTAVGIDLAEDLLEVARSRARELGIEDRATFVVADAQEFRDPDGFDAVFWPQTFYPGDSRGAALAGAFANLRPGGLLVTVEPPPDALGGSVAAALDALIRDRWGVPRMSGDDLRDELAEAGFQEISAARSSGVMLPFVTARRPPR